MTQPKHNDFFMNNSIIKKNADAITEELNWLARVIDTSIKLFFKQPCEYLSIYEIAPPDISNDDSFYAEVLKRDQVDFSERIVMLLALAPHVKPELLDVFLIKNQPLDRLFTEFGGLKTDSYGGFIPTGETAAFILATNDLENRFNLFNFFCDEHFFKKRNILRLAKHESSEPYLSGALTLSLEYLSYLTVGVSKFTAQHIGF